jgi:hypothetical protein
MLDALRLSLQTTGHDLADAEQEIALAESNHADAPTIDLFGATSPAPARSSRMRSAFTTQETRPAPRKASEDAKIAANMVLHEIRFAAAERPITHPPEKKKRRSAASG